jgi:hypothetical protein
LPLNKKRDKIMAMKITDNERQFGNYLISLESNKHAIIRHVNIDEDVQPTFYEMQILKCIAFGGDSIAVEIYPRQKDLFDGQNQRHLWKIELDEFPLGIYQKR